jgi:hypothetical protein
MDSLLIRTTSRSTNTWPALVNQSRSTTFASAAHSYAGSCVGAAEVEVDGELFDKKMIRLTTELREQTEQAAKVELGKSRGGGLWRMSGKPKG